MKKYYFICAVGVLAACEISLYEDINCQYSRNTPKKDKSSTISDYSSPDSQNHSTEEPGVKIRVSRDMEEEDSEGIVIEKASNMGESFHTANSFSSVEDSVISKEERIKSLTSIFKKNKPVPVSEDIMKLIYDHVNITQEYITNLNLWSKKNESTLEDILTYLDKVIKLVLITMAENELEIKEVIDKIKLSLELEKNGESCDNDYINKLTLRRSTLNCINSTLLEIRKLPCIFLKSMCDKYKFNHSLIINTLLRDYFSEFPVFLLNICRLNEVYEGCSLERLVLDLVYVLEHDSTSTLCPYKRLANAKETIKKSFIKNSTLSITEIAKKDYHIIYDFFEELLEIVSFGVFSKDDSVKISQNFEQLPSYCKLEIFHELTINPVPELAINPALHDNLNAIKEKLIGSESFLYKAANSSDSQIITSKELIKILDSIFYSKKENANMVVIGLNRHKSNVSTHKKVEYLDPTNNNELPEEVDSYAFSDNDSVEGEKEEDYFEV